MTELSIERSPATKPPATLLAYASPLKANQPLPEQPMDSLDEATALANQAWMM